ncbi:hypothetical protein GGR53DRAFT_525712 [Hypoxylon sp. FL1150]|nr:hypothetical protein GGR53DRAFT_525712 [Hypoxylon sp. FL1150]
MKLLSFTTLATGMTVPVPRALYFLENNPAGANIVSLKVSDQDGSLSNPARISTGGNGLVGIGSTGAGVTMDTLFSQDAVVVSGSHLFTVNSGANTVSLFAIPRDDPWRPQLVGSPVPSGGDFPMSIAYSPRHRLACVANSGAKNTVQCYDVTSAGLQPSGEPMALPLNQTTPPVGPPSTVSDIVFNPSQSALFVTIKGDANAPGYIYAYPVSHGKVLPTPRVSRPAALSLNFGLSFLGSDSRAIIADPGFGGAFLDFDCHMNAVVSKVVNVTSNVANCWTQYSADLHTAYLLDAATTDITVLDAASMEVKSTIAGLAATTGKFDAAIGDDYLYTLDATDSISVYSLKKSTTVQTFNLTGFGDRQFFQGMAFYGGPAY